MLSAFQLSVLHIFFRFRIYVDTLPPSVCTMVLWQWPRAIAWSDLRVSAKPVLSYLPSRRGPSPAFHRCCRSLDHQAQWIHIQLLSSMHHQYFLGAVSVVPEFHHDHPASRNVDDSSTPHGQVTHTEVSSRASRTSRSCRLGLPELRESSPGPASTGRRLSELPAYHIAVVTPLVTPLQPQAL